MKLGLRHAQDERLILIGHDTMLRSGRMSSAGAARAAFSPGTLVAGLAWTALAAVVALGGAGIVASTIHVPGAPARGELTWTGDQALTLRLDAATRTLAEIAANVDRMADASKAALAAIAAGDSKGLETNLERGNGAAVLISTATLGLRQSLAGLPGDGPDAALQFSNPVLVRRAEILAAMDAALTLAESWSEVTGRSIDAGRVTGLLQQHEQIVFDASRLGFNKQYADAIAKIETAKITLADIASLRNAIVPTGDITILDEWLDRHSRYDTALENLYIALMRSKSRNTLAVQAAVRDEKAARELLPKDNRAIVVIVAQLAQGGLNQAVLAINDAQGRIERALTQSGGA